MVCLLRLVLYFCQRTHGLELISTACRVRGFFLFSEVAVKKPMLCSVPIDAFIQNRCTIYSDCQWNFFSSIDETWWSFSLSLIQMFWSGPSLRTPFDPQPCWQAMLNFDCFSRQAPKAKKWRKPRRRFEETRKRRLRAKVLFSRWHIL